MLGATMRPLLVSSVNDDFGDDHVDHGDNDDHDDHGDDRDNDRDQVGDRW